LLEIPWTIVVEEEMLPPLLMLLELSQSEETVPNVREFSVEPPTMPTAFELLELSTSPQPEAVSLDPLLMFRSCPEPPSRQTQVWLVSLPPAIDVAETCIVLKLLRKAPRNMVEIGLETVAST